MISELDDQTCYKVSEAGGTFASFVDALYCGNPKQPPISKANVESLVELAHKYDVSDIAAHCDLFISGLNFGLSSLPRVSLYKCTRWYALAGGYQAAARSLYQPLPRVCGKSQQFREIGKVTKAF